MTAAGWPATAGGWAVVGGWEQGGVKGWFRSMAIPRRWTVGPWSVAPWELPSLVCPAGHGDEVKGRISLREAVRPIGSMKKQGAGAGSLFLV